jgi:hypothetical protein
MCGEKNCQCQRCANNIKGPLCGCRFCEVLGVKEPVDDCQDKIKINNGDNE